MTDPSTPVPSDEAVEALTAENARLRKLVEPKEWMGWEQVDSIYDEARLLRRERDAAILERDEMRKANVTPEDAGRPLGQSVEYWQDRALDYATAHDKARVEIAQLRAQLGDRAEARAATLREVEAVLSRWQREAEQIGHHALVDTYKTVRGAFAAHFNPEANDA